jgi:hypothetical protein
VADGDIPISAILTAASLHDSQVAIPLATMTAQRVTNLYDLMDNAYDAPEIKANSRALGHVPIIRKVFCHPMFGVLALTVNQLMSQLAAKLPPPPKSSMPSPVSPYTCPNTPRRHNRPIVLQEVPAFFVVHRPPSGALSSQVTNEAASGSPSSGAHAANSLSVCGHRDRV